MRCLTYVSRTSTVLLLLLTAVSCGAPDRPATGEAPADAARVLLEDLMAEASIPGMSVAIARNGELLWSEGLGWADAVAGVEVTPQTLFRIGSVSKSLTAVGLGTLMDQGAVDLDEHVQTYVPTFPEKPWPITTRQLGGHTAGIRHYVGDEFFSDVHYPDVASGLAIFAQDNLRFEPGTEYSYSSYGWNLLSAVMEGASGGEPFLDLMANRVFEPLGMDATFPDMATEDVPLRTTFYDGGPVGAWREAPYVDNSYKWAGGGFLSTPQDLVRFADSVLEPGFLSQETLDVLLTSQHLTDGSETGYGIGWRVGTTSDGHRSVWHTGGSVGGTTILWIDRDDALVIAMVANRADAPITSGDLVGELRGIFAPTAAAAAVGAGG